MTVIAGVETPNGVYIAGDSACVSEYDLFLRAEPKVFTRGGIVIGTAGGGRIMDLAKYGMTLPQLPDENIDHFLRTDFISTVRLAMHDGGSVHSGGNGDELDGNYLVGVYNKLYIILSDFSIHTPLQGFAAIGSGSQVANGAFYATQDWNDPLARLSLVVRAAEEFCAGVRGPFYFCSTNGEEGTL